MNTGLGIDLGQARAALTTAARRTGALLDTAADPYLAVPGSAWSVAEVAAHLAIGLRVFTDAVGGEYRSIAVHIPPMGAFPDRLSAVTAGTLTEETERNPQVLGRMIADRVEEYLAATSTRTGSEIIATPWYGEGASLSLATATALLVGEQILHGYDMAGALGRPWPITTADAHLVILATTSMMPLALNREAAAGMVATYGVKMRAGGPQFVVRIDHGAATTEPATGQPVDCRLSADPVAFLLLGYGRIGQWGPVAKGQLLAWGRRPWLALRFAALFHNP